MDNQDIITYRRKRFAVGLVGITLIISAGLFWILCGLGLFPFYLSEAIVPSILLTLGIFLIVLGSVQSNAVSLWVGAAAIVVSIFPILVALTELGYGRLYPIIIVAPAVASIVTMVYCREFWTHIKFVLFFLVIAFLLMLSSLLGVSIAIVLPIILSIVVLTVAALIIVIKIGVSKELK